jgi:hypothetical protein
LVPGFDRLTAFRFCRRLRDHVEGPTIFPSIVIDAIVVKARTPERAGR